jgi:hypothetical protein
MALIGEHCQNETGLPQTFGALFGSPGSCTTVKIGGKKAKRSAIRAGMERTAQGEGPAKSIVCKEGRSLIGGEVRIPAANM